MKYRVWIDSIKPEVARLSDAQPKELDSLIWKVMEGISIKDEYPTEDVIWNLDSRTNGKQVIDGIPNFSSIYTVSTRLKEHLEKTGANFEFLPFKIRDKRKRILSETYWIVNLLDIIHCTDIDRSMYVESSMNEGQIMYFQRCVLDQSKIPDNAVFFRLGEMKKIIVVQEEWVLSILERFPELKGQMGLFQLPISYGAECRPQNYKPHPEVGY